MPEQEKPTFYEYLDKLVRDIDNCYDRVGAVRDNVETPYQKQCCNDSRGTLRDAYSSMRSLRDNLTAHQAKSEW